MISSCFCLSWKLLSCDISDSALFAIAFIVSNTHQMSTSPLCYLIPFLWSAMFLLARSLQQFSHYFLLKEYICQVWQTDTSILSSVLFFTAVKGLLKSVSNERSKNIYLRIFPCVRTNCLCPKREWFLFKWYLFQWSSGDKLFVHVGLQKFSACLRACLQENNKMQMNFCIMFCHFPLNK